MKNQPRKWLPNNRVLVSFRIKVLSHVSLGKELFQHLEHYPMGCYNFEVCGNTKNWKKAAAELKCRKGIYIISSQQFEFNKRRHQADTEQCRARWKAKVSTISFSSLRRTETIKMCPEKKKKR